MPALQSLIDLASPVNLTPLFASLAWDRNMLDDSSEDGEDTLIASATVFGQGLHVWAARVTVDHRGWQVGTRDTHKRLKSIWRECDGAADTATIPGFPGDWVVWMEPSGV